MSSENLTPQVTQEDLLQTLDEFCRLDLDSQGERLLLIGMTIIAQTLALGVTGGELMAMFKKQKEAHLAELDRELDRIRASG